VGLSVNLGIGDDKTGKFAASGSESFSTTTTDTNSQTITQGTGSDFKAQGNGDGVNHDQDTFLILVNPAIAIQQNQTFRGIASCVSAGVDWKVGASVSANNPSGSEIVLELTVAQLKNPASMAPNVLHQLQALNFTNTDFQTILALDPFANGATTIDPARFSPTTFTFSYEPLQSSQCTNGVCSCVSAAESLKNETATGTINAVKTEYKAGFSASLSGINLGIFNFGESVDENFTWTSTSTVANTTDSSQSATATVSCAGPNYLGPIFMAVYWDNLYGSFVFVPTGLTPPTVILTRGKVTGASGQPLRGQAVTLSFGGKTFHTTTDHLGTYVFPAPPGVARTGAGLVQVQSVRQPVTVGSTQQIAIRVP